MRDLPLRRLTADPQGGADRLFYHNIWFRGHNNPRYAELLPRLDRVDCYLIRCSDNRLARGVQFKVLHATRRVRFGLIHSVASKRYRGMFTTDVEQIPYFRGQVVADVDDPTFSDQEVALLSSSNLKAFVVTAAAAGIRFRELGVRTPFHVIPHGVSLTSMSRSRIEEVAKRHRRPGEVVLGYVAADLLTKGDRHGENPMYNIDHLLELWSEIRRRAPNARLWLIGRPTRRVKIRCGGREDIVLFGRLPREQVLSHVANFDIGLYPRLSQQGVQAAKIAEYMGAGVPTVSYAYPVTLNVREARAGVLVRTPREFVAAVEQLCRDEAMRALFANSARNAGAALDWELLAARYQADILDQYLPRDPKKH